MTQTQTSYAGAVATTIRDVSPTVITGRMLSFAATSDGETLFAGTYSNVWRSDNAGQTWLQCTSPQPPDGQFGVPGALGGWCAIDMTLFDGWRIVIHPRFLADIRGIGRADLVCFGDDGVWTTLSNGDGTFQAPQFVLPDFGYGQGWRGDKHLRMLGDVSGSGRADIVAFGDDGVYIAFSNGDGTFTQADKPALQNLGHRHGWRSDRHPRVLADITGNGRCDIVAFGDDGVYVASNNGDGTFTYTGQPVLPQFGHNHGWRVEKHLRVLADITGSGRADIVAFGDDGVYIAFNNGDGTFNYTAEPVIANFGYSDGWHADKHPRVLADVTGNGLPDIVAFGDAGVYVALNNGDGTFQPPKFVLSGFGYNQGWRVDKHIRVLADITGNGRADIVAFGDEGVWAALSGREAGTIAAPRLILPIFGWNPTLLVLTRYDRESLDAGIYRSTDYGNSWTRVYAYKRTATASDPQPPVPPAGQLLRAPASGHLVYAACGNTFAVSSNAGWSFTDSAIPQATQWDEFLHVAASVPASAGTVPQALYVLGSGIMFVSFDGGTTWTRDTAPPQGAGPAVGTAVSAAPNVLVVSPLSPYEVFTVLISGELWHGDYTNFSSTQQSLWSKIDSLPQPVPGGKPFRDSGCVNLAVPPPGGGNVLFVSPMQSNAYVGSLDAQSQYVWQQLDVDYQVHVDLHGTFLSADFKAGFQNGQYQPQAGAVWLLSDGGIYKSTNGGLHFQYSAHGVSTLAAVNVAGVDIPYKGVALSFNTGDNDGFYSIDGGAVWSPQDYGGGDNDCAFADPLRPSSMLVFTPRWRTKLAFYDTAPGSLPDARSGTSQKFYIDGPPPPNTLNAVSTYGERGSRPIVLNLFGDSPHLPGDYVFVVFTTDTAGTPRATVMRTQNVPDISANDWIIPGGNIVQQGPDLPDPYLGVLQSSGGHANTVFYAGGNYANELWKWSNGMAAWQRIVPGAGSTIAIRFFVSPYNPDVIYILDEQDVKRSDDGGATWQQDASLQQQLTCNGRIPIARGAQSDLGDNVEVVLTDMQFDPYLANVRFAIGEGGVFYTDDAVNWHRLLDTGAMPGRPMNIYYDCISETGQGSLYVSFAGRGLLKIGPVPTQQPGLIVVPDVLGLPSTLAVQKVTAAHLAPHLTGATTPGSWVFTQMPPPGEIVVPGTTITLFLHRGPLP